MIHNVCYIRKQTDLPNSANDRCIDDKLVGVNERQNGYKAL